MPEHNPTEGTPSTGANQSKGRLRAGLAPHASQASNIAEPANRANPPSDPGVRNRSGLTQQAIGPDGSPFVTRGQAARALQALVAAGVSGCTALDVSSWAFRLAAYVHTLRREFGLVIETVRELHEGGWHGRYVLRSTVVLVEDTR